MAYLMLTLAQTRLFFITNAFSDLPSASTYHGAVAHVHATGGLYFAHGGNWIRLNDETTGPVTKYTTTAAMGLLINFLDPELPLGIIPILFLQRSYLLN